MLGDLHLGPGAQPGRRQQCHQRRRRAEHDRGLDDADGIADIMFGDLGQPDRDRRIQHDRRHRRHPQRDAMRHRQPALAAPHAERQHERHRGHDETAQRHRPRQGRAEAIAQRRDDQIGPPHARDGHGERTGRASTPVAAGYRHLMHQHQPDDRRQHARDQPHRDERGAHVGAQRDRFDHRQHRRQHGDRRGHGIDREQWHAAGSRGPHHRRQQREPDEIAQRFGQPRGHVARADPGDGQRPERGDPAGERQRPARPGRGRMPQPGDGQPAERQCRQRMAPEDQRRHDLSARPSARAPRAASGAGSAGRGTANSSWHNTDRIPACGGRPRSTRHKDS